MTTPNARTVWTPEDGWHDGPPARVDVDEVGRIRFAPAFPHDTTTPEGLGYEHGCFAAEHGDSAEHLSDDEVMAYFVTADRAATLTAYRAGFGEGLRESDSDRFCSECGADVIGNDPHEPGCGAACICRPAGYDGYDYCRQGCNPECEVC